MSMIDACEFINAPLTEIVSLDCPPKNDAPTGVYG